MQPGKTETIKIGMYATSVLIRKGHRIRIAVAGNDRATFERIPGQGKTDLTIQHNRTQFSFVELPFVMLQ